MHPIASTSSVLLYHTGNSHLLQYYDCIYYTLSKNAIQAVKYCIQLAESQYLSRSFTDYHNCSGRGDLYSFSQLKSMNISAMTLLERSSSIEQVDQYAKYLLAAELINDVFICNCSSSGAFGKFCEYKFYFDWETFDEAIEAQFNQLVIWILVLTYITIVHVIKHTFNVILD
ncbi:unnamed protein product [Rotaria magnacalcarata]|uniref:Uncharacterized protein n=1 Tax=Rotaria magnacalcarata TaxID=392030 RepID=A0A816X4M6_9BILA|nr:unnamed protein product [Rotaria magnacalcarata]